MAGVFDNLTYVCFAEKLFGSSDNFAVIENTFENLWNAFNLLKSLMLVLRTGQRANFKE